MKKRLTVLSLFDGISSGKVALDRAGIEVRLYYASEVDKHSIAVSAANHPDIIRLGNVRDVEMSNLFVPDLILAGSPCQSFSFSGKMNGMSTTCNQEILSLERYKELKAGGFVFQGQSYLFWEFIRILRDAQQANKNVKFLLENVVMTEKWENVISNELGIKPIKINSWLLSAQRRNRLYWTNIKGVEQPEDLGIDLSSVIEPLGDGFINKGKICGRFSDANGDRCSEKNSVGIKQILEVCANWRNKSSCLTTVAKDTVLTDLPVGNHRDPFLKKHHYRNYTKTEMCRLQTLPDNYCDVASDNQALKMLGNGWTVDVIAHILKNLHL